MKYKLIFGERKSAIFTPNGKKVVPIGEGMVLVNAKIKVADGTIFDAILEIDTWSSGEHCGTYVLLPNGITHQHDEDFLEKLGKTQEQVYPYAYKYTAPLPCNDIHATVGEWSR